MRIGIVNDLPMAVEVMRRALLSTGRHHVAWIARNGVEAVSACARDMPDLVLMDLLMPEMDGVEATRRIMACGPCPILIVTVSVGANASRVFEALGYGAVDAVDTPILDGRDSNRTAAAFLAKIDHLEWLVHDKGPVRPNGKSDAAAHKLLAIGASAGGPAAVATVLAGLPADFPAATVIVQHIDEHFARGMADWLTQETGRSVRVAEEGEAPIPGTILLAGSSDHLAFMDTNRLGYTPEPRSYAHRPSVDVFFHSVSHYWPGEVVGVILTGMGRDGAEGLKGLRAKGHHTIAQDEASSTVYGMPKAAASLGAAVEVLPLDGIAAKIVSAFARRT